MTGKHTSKKSFLSLLKQIDKRLATIAAIITVIAFLGISDLSQIVSLFSGKEQPYFGKTTKGAVEVIINKYFRDYKLTVDRKEKYQSPQVTIYSFNGEALDNDCFFAMAEDLIGLAENYKPNIKKIDIFLETNESFAYLEGTYKKLILPVVMWSLVHTTDNEGKTIWVSQFVTIQDEQKFPEVVSLKRDYFNSSIGKNYDEKLYDLEKTNFEADNRYFYDEEWLKEIEEKTIGELMGLK